MRLRSKKYKKLMSDWILSGGKTTRRDCLQVTDAPTELFEELKH